MQTSFFRFEYLKFNLDVKFNSNIENIYFQIDVPDKCCTRQIEVAGTSCADLFPQILQPWDVEINSAFLVRTNAPATTFTLLQAHFFKLAVWLRGRVSWFLKSTTAGIQNLKKCEKRNQQNTILKYRMLYALKQCSISIVASTRAN